MQTTGGTIVTIADDAKCALGPELRAGERYLNQQLSAHGVRIPLSDACSEAFVRNAHEAVARTRRPDETYSSCLHRHLEARARFIFLWTGSDERFEEEHWSELVAIARKYAPARLRQAA